MQRAGNVCERVMISFTFDWCVVLSGVSFFSQSRSVVMQNQLLLDTQMKTALFRSGFMIKALLSTPKHYIQYNPSCLLFFH